MNTICGMVSYKKYIDWRKFARLLSLSAWGKETATIAYREPGSDGVNEVWVDADKDSVLFPTPPKSNVAIATTGKVMRSGDIYYINSGDDVSIEFTPAHSTHEAITAIAGKNSLALLDSADHTLTLYRDCLPLFVSWHNNCFCFSSRREALPTGPENGGHFSQYEMRNHGCTQVSTKIMMPPVDVNFRILDKRSVRTAACVIYDRSIVGELSLRKATAEMHSHLVVVVIHGLDMPEYLAGRKGQDSYLYTNFREISTLDGLMWVINALPVSVGVLYHGMTDYLATTRFNAYTVELLESLLGASMRRPPRIVMPFRYCGMKDIIELAINEDVELERTIDCDNSRVSHCGTCSGCQRRIRGFQRLNLIDPAEYEHNDRHRWRGCTMHPQFNYTDKVLATI